MLKIIGLIISTIIASSVLLVTSLLFAAELNKYSVMKIYIGAEGKECSGTRITEDIVLSAAHCFLGFDGKREIAQAHIYDIKGKKHLLEVVEVGQFDPRNNKMQDWILLKPIEGKIVLTSIPIVSVASKDEINHILNKQGDYEGKQTGVAILSVTYPGHFIRMAPRPGFNGKGVFISRGHILNDEAYKKHILLIANEQQSCDSEYISYCPSVEGNINNQWNRLTSTSILKAVKEIYLAYEKDDDPILYHTADYSYGSSGGGFFIEESGHLLGIVTMSYTIGDRQYYYCVGQLYRVDVICRQSKTLSDLNICKKL